jgi:hypothetical protein
MASASRCRILPVVLCCCYLSVALFEDPEGLGKQVHITAGSILPLLLPAMCASLRWPWFSHHRERQQPAALSLLVVIRVVMQCTGAPCWHCNS